MFLLSASDLVQSVFAVEYATASASSTWNGATNTVFSRVARSQLRVFDLRPMHHRVWSPRADDGKQLEAENPIYSGDIN